MTKTLSTLSIATIALLAATAPCFAQSQSTETRSDADSSISTTGGGATLAFNRNPFALAASGVSTSSVELEVANKVAAAKSPITLSVSMFKAVSQVTNNKLFLGSQVNAYQPVTFDSRQQFRADDDTTSRRSRVSFVPSRGPWMLNSIEIN